MTLGNYTAPPTVTQYVVYVMTGNSKKCKYILQVQYHFVNTKEAYLPTISCVNILESG